MRVFECLHNVSGLTLDSREVKAGMLFAALPGSKADGRLFIEAAIQKGATHILAPKGTVLPSGAAAVLIEADDVRETLAHMSAAFYAPAPEKIVAVTGTNGKTSTAVFAQQLWDLLGYKSAALGTLGIVSRVYVGESKLTTPDSVSLHKTLADMAQGGVVRVAMEASSIGVEQRRMDGVRICAAGYTNFTQDHLDYHGDMEAYFLAKRRLFDVMDDAATAVICTDDVAGEKLADYVRGLGRKVIAFGAKGDLRIVSQTPRADGQDLVLEYQGQTHEVFLPLAGMFQGVNALCAALLVMAADDLALADILAQFKHLTGVRGRLESVAGHPKGAGVYVDYAHTPAGIETVLSALKPHVSGKLICVFGCGGDRDAKKRPLMAQAAAQYADVVIVTDDNPRSENPADIRRQALVGAPNALEIGDRRAAIAKGVMLAEFGDVIVIAGKGHETGQEIAGNIYPFDDVNEAIAAIEDMKNAV